MVAGIAIDSWKRNIFERHLTAAEYAFTTGAGVTNDTLLLKVQTEDLKALEVIVREANDEATRTKSVPPVDRSARILVSGAPVPEDYSHTELKENGQQKDYIVLTASERSKGFVRPYRDAYRHLKCGKITTMSRAIAETYARDPHFYTGTFCTTCGSHFPIGETGEFVWYEMNGTEGPKVGT